MLIPDSEDSASDAQFNVAEHPRRRRRNNHSDPLGLSRRAHAGSTCDYHAKLFVSRISTAHELWSATAATRWRVVPRPRLQAHPRHRPAGCRPAMRNNPRAELIAANPAVPVVVEFSPETGQPLPRWTEITNTRRVRDGPHDFARDTDTPQSPDAPNAGKLLPA